MAEEREEVMESLFGADTDEESEDGSRDGGAERPSPPPEHSHVAPGTGPSGQEPPQGPADGEGTSGGADPGTPMGTQEEEEEEEGLRKERSDGDQGPHKKDAEGAGIPSAGPRNADEVARDVFGDSDSEDGEGEGDGERGKRDEQGTAPGMPEKSRVSSGALGAVFGDSDEEEGEEGKEQEGGVFNRAEDEARKVRTSPQLKVEATQGYLLLQG